MTGPEKFERFNQWLLAHPWWCRGMSVLFALITLVIAASIRYGARCWR